MLYNIISLPVGFRFGQRARHSCAVAGAKLRGNMYSVSEHWATVQPTLFPSLEDELGELGEDERLFVKVAEELDLDAIIGRKGKWKRKWTGRPPASATAIFKAFVFKAVFNFPTTSALVASIRSAPRHRRLCGWEALGEVPSESSFSLYFDDFAEDGTALLAFNAFVAKVSEGRVAMNASFDSTKVEARERAATSGEKAAALEAARVRAEIADGKADPNALALQRRRDAQKNVSLLPTLCDRGRKRDSKGNAECWTGYKLHLAVVDGDIPVGAVLTSASMHDSKAMIPLMQDADGRLEYRYCLADAAYDAREIRECCGDLDHVTVIDGNRRRGGDAAKLSATEAERRVRIVPADKARYRARSGVERVNGHLHDAHGGRFVRVRGAKKVFLHLLFGLLVIAVEQASAIL